MSLDPLTHPDADGLRAAVACDPDSDTPRLAYADWLDDHGNEIWRARGEFIRLSVTAARHSRDSKNVPLPLTADRLLLSFYHYWWLELPDWLRTAEQGATPAPTQGYRRGFMAQFLKPGELWAKGVNQQPRMPIEDLEIWYRRGRANPLEVGEVPQLSTVRELTICFDSHTMGAIGQALSRSGLTYRLRNLTLWGQSDRETSEQLAVATGLCNVCHLSLKATGDQIMEAGPLADLLDERSDLLGLQSLELHGVGTTSELQTLVRNKGLRKLQHLLLSGPQVTNEVTQALAEARHATQLRSLSLKQTRLTDHGIEALNTSALSALKTLDLQGCFGWFGRAPVPIGRMVRQRLRNRFPSVAMDN